MTAAIWRYNDEGDFVARSDSSDGSQDDFWDDPTEGHSCAGCPAASALNLYRLMKRKFLLWLIFIFWGKSLYSWCAYSKRYISITSLNVLCKDWRMTTNHYTFLYPNVKKKNLEWRWDIARFKMAHFIWKYVVRNSTVFAARPLNMLSLPNIMYISVNIYRAAKYKWSL